MSDKDFIINSINNNCRDGIKYIYPIKSYEEIAKYMVAFSNVEGGVIIFGIKDTGTKLEIKGCNFNISKSKLLEFIDSDISFDVIDVEIENKNLKYIKIQHSSNVVKSNNIIYEIDKSTFNAKEIKETKLFLSYSHIDFCIADLIEEKLTSKLRYTSITRDIKNTAYKDSFTEFMKSIGEHDYVLSIVSDNYLKSINCMYEIAEIFKSNNYKEKFHFIVISDEDKIYYDEPIDVGAKIYKSSEAINYINFWKTEYNKLNKLIKEVDDPSLTVEIVKELNIIKQIQIAIQTCIDYLKDTKGIGLSEMISSDFKDIVEHIK